MNFHDLRKLQVGYDIVEITDNRKYYNKHL